jgi:uncharacterized protein YjiS (DUF1127 family)
MVLRARQYDDRQDDKPVAASNTAAAPILADGQQQRGRWQRLLDALYAGRLSSARREIERHRDVIALLRRRLVERGQHLHSIPDPSSTAAPDLGIPPARWFRVSVTRVRAGLVAARQMMAQWRRRVLTRNELGMLGDGDLGDIRWTRAEVESECRKPFWRA